MDRGNFSNYIGIRLYEMAVIIVEAERKCRWTKID